VMAHIFCYSICAIATAARELRPPPARSGGPAREEELCEL
jgi:hypothetical protein